MKRLKYILATMAFFFAGNIFTQTINTNNSLSFLALGDSYTIGESVEERERWPVQLGQALQFRGINVQEVRIIAQTGWRTDNLQDAINAQTFTKEYDLVSLLIGVNNQYQGGSLSAYEVEFEELLQTAIDLAGGDRSKVMVVSIPDYAYTPFGNGSTSISREIDDFNAANREITNEYNIAYHNITPISRRGLEEPNLVADDELHPSGEMYKLWVDQIMEDIVFTDDTFIENQKLKLRLTLNGNHLYLTTGVTTDLKIYNLEGKLILQKRRLSPQQNHEIALSSVNAGLYIVRLESNNNFIASGKILIPGR
ncbi:GDSL-type esterase/lipase family protein [Marinilabilia rubra]|uniref:Lysophospholipase n=1 Tax=Marinilabilia rubra TaxID=2162893 RepID=A0A2U2B884_9BACT|nr:GDSL-type esterase/lipase family protein [Marinilabilia rubra]PWD99256.1 lysophospholipase [Marinilabilia rubra]